MPKVAPPATGRREQADSPLTHLTPLRQPLRQLVDETSPYLVIAALVDIIGELEERTEGEENHRWQECGKGLRIAKRYADEHWKDS